jgi:broad specificity phosphatase PhoE
MLAYVVRHAESLSNAKADEGLNTPLSPLGFQQAEALGGRFERLHVGAIYSSPYLRSIQTGLPIARRLHLPIRIRPEVCEFQGFPPGTQIDLGLDEIAAIAHRHPETIPCPDCADPFAWPPADESLSGMIARVRSFGMALKARWPADDDTVVVIGHGSPIARMIEAWLTDQPGPSFRFTIDNAAIAAVRYLDGVSSLVCLNDVCHLRDLPVAEKANYRPDGSIKPIPASGYW